MTDVSPQVKRQVEAWLEFYGQGKKPGVSVPLSRPVVSDFAKKVYAELEAIGWGETATYGTIAQRAGKPGAARAVGRLCGANPLPLFIPCQRVVAASGIGGFAFGAAIKQRLLAWESAF
jgi:methylated-DNA-[protein]-cysteine S-methyltransferase